MSSCEALNQEAIDAKNAEFWDELCGSTLARQLGIADSSPESLKRFDDWYLNFYPYLFKHIPLTEMAGKDVLEVGLGYGTVTQQIIEVGANYHGLDIAAGPIAMARHRCRQLGVDEAGIRQGSILEPPFNPGSFDAVVAIGCLHHTGNLPDAIKSVHRLLKPGGQASIMVYSATSYRQLVNAPVATIRRKMMPRFLPDKAQLSSQAWERGSYDLNAEDEAAPHTEFVTKSELRRLCSDFSDVRIATENIGRESIFGYVPRNLLCRVLGPVIGLDLYCQLRK